MPSGQIPLMDFNMTAQNTAPHVEGENESHPTGYIHPTGYVHPTGY